MPTSVTIVSTVPPVILTPRYVLPKTVSVACTRYPGCCPPHSSVSDRLCLDLFCIVLFVFVYMFLSVLAFCPAVATPPLSRCLSLFRTRSAMPRMQKSRSSVLRTQRYGRYILLSLTQPQWRLACSFDARSSAFIFFYCGLFDLLCFTL